MISTNSRRTCCRSRCSSIPTPARTSRHARSGRPPLRPAQAEIDRLTLLQRQLNAARTQQADLEAKVAAARREAAANLKIKKGLEARAAAQESTVARLLRQRKTAEDAAATDVAQDKARYSELIKERASVERRIAARIAKAAAERKRAAERKASQRSRSATKQSHRSRQRQRSSNHSTMSSASHGFSFPVAAHITSPFGMRFHVLRYWKLHDGTDFGAACGTPIRASGRSGRGAVLQRRLWQPVDDRPRPPGRQVRDHGLQPRQPLHSSRGSTCPKVRSLRR